MTKERNHLYRFYILCECVLLLLDDESIIDLELSRKERLIGENILKIKTDDRFFLNSLQSIKEKDFYIVLQTYEVDEYFSHQFELSGEDFTIEENCLIFDFQTIYTNHMYPSINPSWEKQIEQYYNKRASFLRDSKIENILE